MDNYYFHASCALLYLRSIILRMFDSYSIFKKKN